MLKRIACLLLGILATTAPAFAHLDPGDHGSFLSGLTHPLSGLDHIVVMVAVGLWAATVGGRALWLLPSAFVACMAGGYGLSLAGIELPFVEPVILASIVALGLLVAAAVRIPVALGATLVGIFALFHGHAHGGELGAADSLAFGIGFAFATALLHLAGIGLGLLLGSGIGGGRAANETIARALGGFTAALGILLAFGSG